MYAIRLDDKIIPIESINLSNQKAYYQYNGVSVPTDLNNVIEKVEFNHPEELWEGDTIATYGSGKGVIIWSEAHAAWCVEILEDAGGSIYKGNLILLKDYHDFHKI